MDTLDSDLKKIVEHIITLVQSEDPFKIKETLCEALATGDETKIMDLTNEFDQYCAVYSNMVLYELGQQLENTKLDGFVQEYGELVSTKPEITEEDLLYIKEIISNSMGKSLDITRDKDTKNLHIKLADFEFLEQDRNDLPLSTGEQNFLSLTLEFLKAKNSVYPCVIIDDPISSFDSIYKNKVVYAVVKMLHEKKRIILTHNLDMVRLLDAQYKKCFNLYLLSNIDGGENGFIPIKQKETEMLISLEKLMSIFRDSIFKYIKDVELFLISMIPFMRGYASIIGNKDVYDSLTNVMHGYKTEKVNIAKVYKELFGNQNSNIPENYIVSVMDILDKEVDTIEIVDLKEYPLLNRTLKHSFTYLFLRLLVEKELVEKYKIDINNRYQLGQIISASFPDEQDHLQVEKRIFLTSKKTLINEFNHFEGNMSIFQPAIDITDQALFKEKNEIISFVKEL